MSFSRDDLATYEKQPQTVVDDKIPPGEIKATAAVTDATSAAKADESAATDPSGGDVESDDQTGSGDGTSDDNAASSTASADPSGESEADEGGAGKPVTPKKGSAAERIQELLDLTEGYKEYGKLKDQAHKDALAEIERLRAGKAEPVAKSEKKEDVKVDDPIPDLSDPDINYDADKLRIKTQKWIDARIKAGVEEGTQRVVSEITGKSAAQKLEAKVNEKVTAFAKTHEDWETKVAKNQTLIDNQLAPEASIIVAESDYTAEILYVFGNDPKLAVRVAKLPPALQIKEVGRLEARIEAEKAVAAAMTSKAPVTGAKPVKQKSLTEAPPAHTPVKAVGRATEREETDPNMSMDDFAKRHRERKQVHRAEMKKARGLG